MKTVLSTIGILFGLALAAAGGWWYAAQQQAETVSKHEVVSRESILTQVKQLNRLESTAFYIDTVIKTQKPGKWYMLWQDAQTGLFMAHGKVLAGIDLAKLTAEQVEFQGQTAVIHLPPVEILSVDLADVDVYDLKTGSFGLAPTDGSVFEEVQKTARRQVLERACQADILRMAQTQAQSQLETLFALTNTQVSVVPAALPACKA